MITSRCKYCGEPIYWLKTEKGRMMPVNTVPYSVMEDRRSLGRYVLKNGKVVCAIRYAPGTQGTVIGYTPHFATCKGNNIAIYTK